MKVLIKITQPIIVEGKYDKITLSNVVDTLIIATNGFSIFKDKEKIYLESYLLIRHVTMTIISTEV